MKMNGNSAAVERNDLLEETAFKIKATGKAFTVLSDGLYADKIRAVIRELSCNAYDAHVAAGKKDVPFTVHLPNALEPYFAVIDTGIGLSLEDVMHIFTTYFESLKSHSNDFIGGLGLGSKSPFSYVDAFTVNSRWNGTKYFFSVFIEDDVPKIALMGEELTTEPNGLEVSMPVKANDFYEFQTKGRSVLSRFNPQPIITGVGGFEFDNYDVLLEGTKWRLLNNFGRRYYGTPAAQAVFGNIAYPINAGAIPNLKTEYQTVLSNPFEFDFNIGELDIAASREALGYKKNTIDNLIKAVDVMYKELPTKFQDSFKDAKTAWEARKVWGRLFRSGTHLSNLLGQLAEKNKITFNVHGQVINSNYLDIPYKNFKSISIARFSGYHHSLSRYAFSTSEHGSFHVTASDDSEFFLNDLQKGSLARVKQYAKSGSNNKSVHLIEGDEAEIKALLAALGNPPTRNTSELPAVVRPKAGPRIQVHEMKEHNWGSSFYSVRDFDANASEGYYVHYVRNRPTRNNSEFMGFDELVKLARKHGLINKDDKIIGVTALIRDKLAKHDNWNDLIDHLTTKLNEMIKKRPELAEEIEYIREYRAFAQDNYYGNRIISMLAGSVNELDQQSPIITFINKMQAAKSDKVNDLQRMTSLMDMTVPVSTMDIDFSAEYKAIETKYPLLSFMEWSGYSKNHDAAPIVQYINLMHK